MQLLVLISVLFNPAISLFFLRQDFQTNVKVFLPFVTVKPPQKEDFPLDDNHTIFFYSVSPEEKMQDEPNYRKSQAEISADISVYLSG